MTGNWGQVVPDRHSGQILTRRDLVFTLNKQEDRESLRCDFRGRDNRLWQATIELQTGERLGDSSVRNFDYLIIFRAAGCRNVHFLAATEEEAKSLLLRFANISVAAYTRMVADARGTLDHPKSDDLGVFRMVVTHVNQAGMRVHNNDYTISGIGHYQQGQLTIFPTSDELRNILEPVCTEESVVLIPDGVNVVDQQEQLTSTARYRGVEVASLTPEQLSDIIDRNFEATGDEVRQNLRSGIYRQRERPARALDFGPDKQTSEQDG